MAPVHKCDASRDLKRKHCTFSITDKVELLKKLESGVPVRRLCELWRVGTSTVYYIKKQKGKLLQFFANSGLKEQMGIRKTMRDGKSPQLGKVPVTWLHLRISEGVELSGDLVRG
ncbi:hypothetical protein M514_05791 [Trichuris suis]|uniref:HTH psq-type domain-containing protein n=1 Tax=Trichuris suis TaxID=68888 RepID=A0A085M7W4_9BILA|nr:hypothetical protein M513_05791 [Trichuris suis]KFD66397.1 hypothetical protein M514_05791 [Trichuris suis]